MLPKYTYIATFMKIGLTSTANCKQTSFKPHRETDIFVRNSQSIFLLMLHKLHTTYMWDSKKREINHAFIIVEMYQICLERF